MSDSSHKCFMLGDRFSLTLDTDCATIQRWHPLSKEAIAKLKEKGKDLNYDVHRLGWVAGKSSYFSDAAQALQYAMKIAPEASTVKDIYGLLRAYEKMMRRVKRVTSALKKITGLKALKKLEKENAGQKG